MRHGEKHLRLQALHRAPPPQQPTLSVVKPEGRPAASVKPAVRLDLAEAAGLVELGEDIKFPDNCSAGSKQPLVSPLSYRLYFPISL